MSAIIRRDAPLFSTPLEIGLRVLFLLELLPGGVDLQRLGFLDYLVIHSGDVGGPDSLHPPTPHRSGEILVKRDVLREALNLMISHDLARVELSAEGIRFSRSELTSSFLQYLDTSYASRLRERASWVAERFGRVDDAVLRSIMSEGIGTWGGEFINEAAVRDVQI